MRRKAMLWEKLEENRVHCYLCSHHCRIGLNDFGFCGMRQNSGGELYTHNYGEAVAANVDPIEKKPFYHFFPGTYAYSIAAAGCNFRCPFCQNWTISQLTAKDGNTDGWALRPEEIIKEARDNNCRSISYTYTEPTVFFEYAYDTAKLAKENGLYNTFVTNGYMTKLAIEKIKPYLDAANIDLKFFSDEQYKGICKGSLQPVLDSIQNMRDEGIWVEVTTLIVPGENDSDDHLRGIAGFLSRTGKDIPWHVSRFHPDYKYGNVGATPIETVENAVRIGKEEGIKYVYVGNVENHGATVCPDCGSVLIERSGFTSDVTGISLENGRCKACGTRIEGIWGGDI